MENYYPLKEINFSETYAKQVCFILSFRIQTLFGLLDKFQSSKAYFTAP